MFCQKCGSELSEGGGFCQKCGAKAVSVNSTESPVILEQGVVENDINPAKTSGFPAILASLWAVYVLVVALEYLSGGDIGPTVRYIGIGLLILTFIGSVINVITSIVSKAMNHKKLVLGIAGIAVAGIAAILIFSSAGNGDYGVSDNYTEDIALGQTYTNSAEGFSFDYPDSWSILDLDEDQYSTVYIASPSETGVVPATVMVVKSVDDGSFDLTIEETQELYSMYSENASVLDLIDTTLDGFSANKLTYTHTPSGDYMKVTQYSYIFDDYIYMIACSALENEFEQFEPTFDAIMDSYQIYP